MNIDWETIDWDTCYTRPDRFDIYNVVCVNCGQRCGGHWGKVVAGKMRMGCPIGDEMDPNYGKTFLPPAPETKRSIGTSSSVYSVDDGAFLKWLTAPRHDTCAHGTAKGAHCRYCP